MIDFQGIASFFKRYPLIGKALRWFLAGMIVVSIAIASRKLMGQLGDHLHRLNWWWLGLATILTVIYRFFNAACWSISLGAVGQPTSTRTASREWLASEACRWLPGSVWNFGSRTVLASRRGVPIQSAGAGMFVELSITIFSWVLLSALGALKFPAMLRPWNTWESIPREYVVAATTALLVITAIAGFLMRSLIARKAIVLRERLREVTKIRPSSPHLLGALAAYVGLGIFNGAGLIVVLLGLGAPEVPPTAVIGANAIAWLIGFFAIFAPGGLVIREGALAALLSPWLPIELGILVATTWRLVQIAAELLSLAALGLKPGESRQEARLDSVFE